MPIKHLLLALLVVVVWGVNFVAFKQGIEQVPPLLLASLRFFLTSIPAVFFVKRPSAPLMRVFGYGVCMFALQSAFLFIGIHAGISPGIASLLTQIQIFITMLFGVIFFQEKIHIWQVVGAGAVILGIGLIGMHLEGTVTLLGFFFTLGAAVAWSLGNLISKKIGRVNILSLVVWGSLVAWPLLLIASLCIEGQPSWGQLFAGLTWQTWGSIVFIAYPAIILGFGVWSWLLHHYSLSMIAPFSVLVPVFALLSSVIAGDEVLYPWKIGAALLILGGLCLHLFGARIFKRS